MVKNNDKKVVTEDNYKQIVLKRMILVCWLLLIICFIIKIFGGNFFEFIGTSEVAEYINNVAYIRIPIQFILYFTQSYLFYMILFRNNHKIISIIASIIMFISKILIDINDIFIYISFIVEFIGLILLPIFMKEKWYNVILLNIAIIVFQLISMITKNTGIINFPYESIVGYVFMIDYYIMLVLTYLYSMKGDYIIMQIGFWFLSKDTTQLEAYKGLLKDKYEKKVAKIDAKIKKINEKK